MKHVVVFTVLALVFAACSSAKVRILPGENGVNKVVSADIEREDAEEAALEEANKYCEKRGKHMFVVREDKTAYKGSMNETTRKGVRAASRTAVMVGQAGGVLSQAGMGGYSATNDRDYEATFQFRCK